MDWKIPQTSLSNSPKIAILGAGFAGLALAFWITHYSPSTDITLFDPLPIGRGTSGLSAGLLHGYTGFWATKSPVAEEGIASTLFLLSQVENFLGRKICWKPGIFRPALQDEQRQVFFSRSQQDPNVVWKERGEDPFCLREGLWIPEGFVIDCPSYLQGLAALCCSRGVTWQQQAIHSLEELVPYSLVFCALGASTTTLFPHLSSRFRKTKGQILQWNNFSSLPYPLIGQGYLVQHPHSGILIGGATYEREFLSEEPDLSTAWNLLQERLIPLLPSLAERFPDRCAAGIRLATPSHIPFYGHLFEKYWILTALGSKGLLLHSLLAKKLILQTEIGLSRSQ